MRMGRAYDAVASCVLATTIALTLAGCDDSSRASEKSPSPASASTTTSPSDSSSPSSSSSSTGSVTLDPAHAVDPPGKRTGRWGPPDIIVTDARTIGDDKVAAIKALEGVTDVEQISRGQALIENRAINVAAVDPATYRNYVTDLRSADKTALWKRVAAGELGLRPNLQKKLPFDDNGFLTLGSAANAPQVHLGALPKQTWQVDAVVNDTWIDDLGLTPGNALLIRTGSAAPDTLRKPIEKILHGTEASVQMTDAVARFGLDPQVVQTVNVVGSVADAVGVYRYTVLSGGRIAPDPAWVKAHIATETVPILGSVTCNKLIFPQLKAALQDVISQGLADKIHPSQYAGCYYPRFIAGTTQLSNHAFGLALDMNVPGNQRGTVGEMDRGVVSIFKHWGFTWGGDWGYTDPMHFEMNRLVRPG